MTTPSAPPRRPARQAATRAWLGGIRVSGFLVIMVGLVVLAVFVLVPTVGTYVDQQQQLRALRSTVAATQAQVEALQSERERWQDPAYIATQARERLYYVKPGEVVYLVDDDLPATAVPHEKDAVSGDVEETRADWMTQLVRSLVAAGVARTTTPVPSEG